MNEFEACAKPSHDQCDYRICAEALRVACQRGDGDAWHLLTRHFGPQISREGSRVLRAAGRHPQPALLDDLEQRVWMSLFADPGSPLRTAPVHDVSELGRRIARLARGRAKDMARSWRADVKRLARAAADLPGAPQVCPPERPIDDADIVEEILQQLPDRERNIIETHILRERPIAEAAGQIGVSSGHARRLVRRALAACRDLWGRGDDAL